MALSKPLNAKFCPPRRKKALEIASHAPIEPSHAEAQPLADQQNVNGAVRAAAANPLPSARSIKPLEGHNCQAEAIPGLDAVNLVAASQAGTAGAEDQSPAADAGKPRRKRARHAKQKQPTEHLDTDRQPSKKRKKVKQRLGSIFEHKADGSAGWQPDAHAAAAACTAEHAACKRMSDGGHLPDTSAAHHDPVPYDGSAPAEHVPPCLTQDQVHATAVKVQHNMPEVCAPAPAAAATWSAVSCAASAYAAAWRVPHQQIARLQQVDAPTGAAARGAPIPDATRGEAGAVCAKLIERLNPQQLSAVLCPVGKPLLVVRLRALHALYTPLDLICRALGPL